MVVLSTHYATDIQPYDPCLYEKRGRNDNDGDNLALTLDSLALKIGLLIIQPWDNGAYK